MGMGKGIFNQLMFWVGPIDQFGQIDQEAVQKSYHSPEGEGGVIRGCEEKVFTLNIWIFNTKYY